MTWLAVINLADIYISYSYYYEAKQSEEPSVRIVILGKLFVL